MAAVIAAVIGILFDLSRMAYSTKDLNEERAVRVCGTAALPHPSKMWVPKII
jgi:hypothetical protein